MGVLHALAGGLLGGLVVGPLVPPIAGRVWLGVAVLGAGLFGMTLGSWAERFGRYTPAALAFVLAAVAGLAMAETPRVAPLAPAGLARIEAEVLSTTHAAEGESSDLRIVQGSRIDDGAEVPSGLKLRLYGASLPPGARVKLLARIAPRVPFRNLTPHPEWPVIEPVGATGRMPEGGSARVLARHPLRGALEAARESVRRNLQRTLSPRVAGLARALVLGEARAPLADDRDAVRRAGLAHVLAVSGLHVSIVAGLLVFFLRALLVRTSLGARFDVSRWSAAVGVPLALAFAAFAGASPSALRAAVTSAVAWTLVALGRRPSAIPVACFAATLLGVADPQGAIRPGFLLSIAATAAILTTDLDRGIVRTAWAISVRTAVATAPLVLWCFGTVPLAGLVANVVLTPAATLFVVPLAAAHAALSFEPLGLHFVSGELFSIVALAFLNGSDAFASAPGNDLLPPLSLAQGVIVTFVAGAWVLVRHARTRWLVSLIGVLSVGAAELHLRKTERPTGVLRISFLDVGQGDAALLDLPDGRSMLVDAGGTIHGGPDPGERVIVPLLRARRRDHLDVVVLSHPHPDHYGGLFAIAENVPVRELWTTRQAEEEDPEGRATKLLDTFRARGTRIRYPDELCDRSLPFGEARVTVLYPCPDYDPGYDPNDNSIVFRIDHGDRSFLFTGDAEHHAESALLASGKALAADVLKVGHHGSRTSSTEAFVARVNPTRALIGCGLGNQFRHPHPEVLSRFAERGVEVVRTDHAGGARLTSDGKDLHVETWSAR